MMPERLAHGPVVRFANRVLLCRVAQPEKHAHALGRREREVITADAERARRIAQRQTVLIEAFQNPAQTLARDRPDEFEPARAGADPLTARLGAAEVVLLDTVADRLDNVDASLGLIEVVPGLAGHELVD